jgi:tight adherence protein B
VTPILLLALAVLGLALGGYAMWRLGVGEREALTRRTALDVVEERSARWRRRLDGRVRHTRLGRRLARRIERAGLRWRVVDVLAALTAIALVGYLAAVQFVSWWIAAAVAFGLCWLALSYFDRRENQRREAFIAQLPEVARVLSNATSAGLALRSAIRMASDDMAEPARTELQHLSNELDIGTSMTEALAGMQDRLPSRELSLLTRTLIIQARSGGAVVTALREMSETLEARKDLRREVRTMLAGSVFTSWVVLVLGVGSILVLNLIAPGTLNKVTTSLIGQAVLLAASSMYALGYFLIRRTTKIEV